MASTVHDSVISRAQSIDGAVLTSAAQANQDVQAAVQNLPADITAAANAQKADAQAKNIDLTARTISLGDAGRAALLNQVQTQVANSIAAAQQQRNYDVASAPNDPRIQAVNPPHPQDFWQILNDYIPSASWTTIGTTAAMVLGGAALTLIPGVGPEIKRDASIYALRNRCVPFDFQRE